MSEIQKMVRGSTLTLLSRMTRRYGRFVTSSLVGSFLFVLLFYGISDGFRESPAGLLVGLLWMLLAVGFFWSRYRQLADFDYAGSLKEGVAALIAQRRRSLRVEQAVIVGATAAGLVLPRLFNGRGLPDLTRLDILLPLGLALLLASALLVTVQRLHRRDIAELNGLLRQLA